jgi:hypothetical protein
MFKQNEESTMKNKLLVAIFIGILVISIAVVPLSYCQDEEQPTDEPTPEPGGPVIPSAPTPTPAASSTPTASGSSATPTPTSSGDTTPKPTATHKPSGSSTPRVTYHPPNRGLNLNYPLIGGIVIVVVAILGFLLVAVKKRGVSEKSLRRYSSSEFQKWVIKRLEGKESSSRDISMGIDGFTHRGYPLLIKQTNSVSMIDIDRFASSLAKNRTRNGVIVAFGYGSDAVRGKVRARTNYRIDIEMLTVSELVYSKRAY